MTRRLPPELRKWDEARAKKEARRRRPSHPELPAPDLEYTELEAAKAFGYRWRDWVAEDPFVRGRLIAHQIESSLREAYETEAATKAAEAKETSGHNAIEAWEEKVFGDKWKK